MAKTYKCDLGMGCTFEAKAWTARGLVRKMDEHAKAAHKMSDLPAEARSKIQLAAKA